MNIPVSLELLAGILGGLVVAMVVLLLLQVRSSSMVNRIAAPAYEFVQHQAEVESEAITDEAKQHAATIIAAAHTENAKVLASYAKHAAELQTSYQDHLKQHSEMLTQKMNGAIAVHLEKLESIGELSLTTLEVGREKLTNRFNVVLESFTQTEREVEAAAKAATHSVTTTLQTATKALTDTLATQDVAIKAHLDKHTTDALVALDAEILTYKAARIKLLDTHMNTIVEAVTKQVLGKQLTLSDHAELVRDALKSARQDSIL